MIYSINENIFTFNSGTEFAAINRQRLFKHFGQASQIVTRNYNPQLHAEMACNDLRDADVVNLYDYFQQALSIAPRHEVLRESAVVDKTRDHIVGIDNNESQLMHHGERFATVRIAPGTVGEIGEMQYVDKYGNPTVTEVWDCRGFRSKTIRYHLDGSVGHEVYYTVAGVPVLEVSHMRVGDTVRASHFKLLNYQGRHWAFSSEDDLFAFFLAELNREVPGILVNDRPSLVVPVARAIGAQAKYLVLHSVHVTDLAKRRDPRGHITPALVPFFEQYARDYQGVICPTQEEADDITRLFPGVRALALPDFAAFPLAETDDVRADGQVLYMGRLAPEKHLDQLLQLFAQVARRVPVARLQLMGYFSDAAYESTIRALVDQLRLTDRVEFTGYLTGAAQRAVLQQARVLVQTSLGEAGHMTLKMGAQYGLPAVAYRVPYGIEDVVTDGGTGYLVAPGNQALFVARVSALLTDQALWAQQSVAATQHADQYAPERVYAAWRQLID